MKLLIFLNKWIFFIDKNNESKNILIKKIKIDFFPMIHKNIQIWFHGINFFHSTNYSLTCCSL